MASEAKSQDSGELLRRALVAIDELEAKLEAAEAAKHEPIAIIGMSCRLPGADTPGQLWDNLVNGVDSVTEVPPYRWDAEAYFDPDPDAPGKSYTKWGGFIGDVETFDAAFFGITPREAAAMDPQHRLLLEHVWRALESANIPPPALSGKNTSIYVGMTSSDFAQLLANETGGEGDAYMASGVSYSIAGGRLSYFLGVHGPNATVDTACSASMVAVHMGVKSLRNGEADSSIACGVNVTLSPGASIITSRARMMSPTGRCNTFDESADGYVRSEGCGAIVMKRLSDAERDGDRILAILRGSALNQDGRSSGLTAPHGPSQEAVIRAALADAGLTPDDVDFIEAHGTGTSLGDPIEVNALSKVFGARAGKNPLLLGSLKANIGHTEPVAGIAGLIKAVQALRNRTLPKQIHLHNPNPMINWDPNIIKVPLETTPLEPQPGKRLVCGVSSFGFSGTNAHVVLEEAPPTAATELAAPADDEAPTLLAFSARTIDAVNELAGAYADLIEGEGEDHSGLKQIAAAAPVARAQFAERVGIVAANSEEASEALRAVAAGGSHQSVIRGRAISAEAKDVVFLFTGQGAQYAGMGQVLYDTDPVFRAAIDECDALAEPILERSLKDIMFGLNGAEDEINDTTYTQPALFALEYALAQSWMAWGVKPAAVMGHSVGEYTAACVAGMLSLEDAIRLIATRGALMGKLPTGGSMAAVFATEEIVRAAIAPFGDALSVAAVNGPTNIVISGEADAVSDALKQLAASGVDAQELNVSHAFHSSLMDPILDEFEAVAAEVTFNEPRITLMSNITGAKMDAEGRRPDYWRRHLREAVRFSDSIAALKREGYRVFLEIGPAPILTGMAQRCGGTEECVYIASMRKGRDDRRAKLEGAAGLFAAGAPIDWSAVVGKPHGYVALPHYPFQRQRYWPATTSSAGKGAFSQRPSGYSLLGDRIDSPVEMYRSQISKSYPSWVRDHKLMEFTPFPASGFLELALEAATISAGPDVQLQDFVVGQSLMLPETGDIDLHVVISESDTGAKTLRVYSEVKSDGAGSAGQDEPVWRLHATASIARAGTPSKSKAPPKPGEGELDVWDTADVYERLEASGAHYGPTFRGIRSIGRRDGQVWAEIELPDSASPGDYLVHPALLDACIQAMGLEVADLVEGLFMPIGAASFRVLQPNATNITCHVVVPKQEAGVKTFAVDITLWDADGNLVAELLQLEMRQLSRAVLEKSLRQSGSGSQTEWCYGVEWRPADIGTDLPGDITGQNWLIFADENGAGAAFAEQMRAVGVNCSLLEKPSELDESTIRDAVENAAPIDQPLHGVAYLWPLDAQAGFESAAELDHEVLQQTTAALYAMRAVTDRAASVLVVTRGVHEATSDPSKVVQSALWAFAGVVAAEQPTCGLKRIDMEAGEGSVDVARLVHEARLSDREDRISYRKGHRYVARMASHVLAEAPDDNPVELIIKERGSLGNLAIEPAERRVPGEGEVEVRVRATGLNFRDVLNALGMYPEEAPLGVECTGIVSAIGPGVEDLQIGDEVIAMTDRTFATYAIADAILCVQKPAYLTHQEAATIPTTFLTAHYGLTHLSHMKAGDRVFIHACTGGVGQAAVQLARRAGAIIYGTAGTPAKRKLAKELGVEIVADSRSLSFVEEIMRATDGKGVDIVLNSLAGDFIPATLGLVRPGGSFIEIGKSDIWSAETVGEKFPDVHYHALFLGEVTAQDPAQIRAMHEDIIADMRPGGALYPLPQTVYDLSRAEEAFRLMAQGLHTGKVVLTQHAFAKPRADGVYIVTGGLTGLGLSTADWLAENGAGNLVLLGRRAPSEEAAAAIELMEEAGARVRVAQADVSNEEGLAKLLEDVRATMGPIRGVFHAAGVIDDGILSEQTPDRISRVLGPKTRGGWALHALTLSDPIDYFVLFSSAAALLGSPGQSNYAAANGFLDGLAAYRQARGLPGLAINWGSWSEIGMATGVGADHHRRWDAMGLETITPDSGMHMLSELVTKGARPQIAAVPIVRSRFPSGMSPFYKEMGDGRKQEREEEVRVDILAEMRDAPANERPALLQAFVADQVRRSLALPPEQKVDVHESLLNLGMDSLMAMELRNRLQATVGVRMPVADLLGGAAVVDLVRTLMAEAPGDDASPEPAEQEWETGRL